MSTVLQVKPDDPSDHVISMAVAVIEAGGLLAYPTDTVYGLGRWRRSWLTSVIGRTS